jgi:hypothetical protein
MEEQAKPVAATRFWEGKCGAALPDTTEVELGHTVMAGHSKHAAIVGNVNGRFAAIDLEACVAQLETVVRGLLSGAILLDAQPVAERWRPPRGYTAAFAMGGLSAIAFTGLATGGASAVVSVPLTAHPTAPMYAAIGVFCDDSGATARFAMVESLLALFVRSDRPAAWFSPNTPVATGVVLLTPGFTLERILIRACMYRIAERVTDARVGSAGEAYTPRHLGAIARRCCKRMPLAASVYSDDPPPPAPSGSPLRREGRRGKAVLPLPVLLPTAPIAALSPTAHSPRLPSPVLAPPPPSCALNSAFYNFIARCTAVSPTRYREAVI